MAYGLSIVLSGVQWIQRWCCIFHFVDCVYRILPTSFHMWSPCSLVILVSCYFFAVVLQAGIVLVFRHDVAYCHPVLLKYLFVSSLRYLYNTKFRRYVLRNSTCPPDFKVTHKMTVTPGLHYMMQRIWMTVATLLPKLPSHHDTLTKAEESACVVNWSRYKIVTIDGGCKDMTGMTVVVLSRVSKAATKATAIRRDTLTKTEEIRIQYIVSP